MEMCYEFCTCHVFVRVSSSGMGTFVTKIKGKEKSGQSRRFYSAAGNGVNVSMALKYIHGKTI